MFLLTPPQLSSFVTEKPPQGSCWLKKDLRTDRSPPTPSRRALSPAVSKKIRLLL